MSARKFLGKGWKFPVGVGTDKEIAMSQYEQDIRESIWIILSTVKGERVMRPDFGCGIHKYTFAPMNTATLNLIERSVREALTIWEHRIKLTKVETITDEAFNGKLKVDINYKVHTTNNRFNLVYPFYLVEK